MLAQLLRWQHGTSAIDDRRNAEYGMNQPSAARILH